MTDAEDLEAMLKARDELDWAIRIASTPTKVCQNETCGREFKVQTSKGKFVRTSGTIYCSPTCAKAQVQRRYRRRLKAAQ